jgi:hypothetical protein
VIWKLIRYSPAWRIAGWASLIYIPLWLLLSQSNDRGIISAPFMLYMAHMAAVAFAPETAFRCTFFDAALPVEGRDLWVSKMIVLLGMVWVPVLAMSAVGWVVVHDPALPFLNAAAGFTAILLAGQSFRIREFHEPLLACIILLIAGAAVMTLLAVALPQFAVRVLAGYLLANVAFFLLAWSRVPKSFTVAPSAQAPAPARERGGTIKAQSNEIARTSSPMRAWWKILRQIYLTYLFLVPLGWLLGGAPLIGIFMIVPLSIAAARTSWQFLAHLPVSPRQLFWAIWVPLPFAMFLGYEAAVYLPSRFPVHSVNLGPRVTAIDWAFILALMLIWMFFFQSWTWRRTRRVTAAIRTVLIAVGMTTAWIATPDPTVWRRYGADPIPYFALKWAAALPENPWILAIALMVPLAGLYWLVERSFCEIEYSTIQTVGESYYQAR